jgi:hypothetical protein
MPYATLLRVRERFVGCGDHHVEGTFCARW